MGDGRWETGGRRKTGDRHETQEAWDRQRYGSEK